MGSQHKSNKQSSMPEHAVDPLVFAFHRTRDAASLTTADLALCPSFGREW
ncbi:hypothetical protein PoMZ_04731 [Pyricularia oryzae]|uniref:Uncharacterized protein n=1 Tax=Pyricularia oryzae TaxID=318829 RepID=A0A4P7NAD6_PYROR|nr:hypothetical protein PoMZ_04731 [Pyricularia oryzae]